MKVTGYYNSGDLVRNANTGEVDIRFDRVYDLGLSKIPVIALDKISAIDDPNEGGGDGDPLTNACYEISWGPNFAKPQSPVYLMVATYKFDLDHMANGQETNINFVVTETVNNTSVEVGNASFMFVNNNGNLEYKAVEPTLIWGNEKTISLDVADAEAGKLIANFKAVRFTPTSYSYTIGGQEDTNEIFTIDADGLKLNKAVTDLTEYNDIVITASDGEVTKSLPGFDLIITGESVNISEGSSPVGTSLLTFPSISEGTEDLVWNVSGLDYGFYEIVAANVEGIYSTSLYGSKTYDGAKTFLGTFDNIGANAEVTIIGNTLKEEDLHVTESAAINLGGIIFKGGIGKLDRVRIDGTEGDDRFTIDTENMTNALEVATVINPYTNLINYYKDFYKDSPQIYENIVKNFNAAYDRLLSIAVTRQNQFNTITLDGGATIKVTGVQGITIDAQAGNYDDFNIVNLGTNYDLIGGDGSSDSISFESENINHVVIDMDNRMAQYVVPGQIGTVRLHGDIEEVFGSKGNDSIITANNTFSVFGNGGNDAVILNGDKETVTHVFLEGRSSVVVRGDGDYSIMIEDGDHSVINAITASSDSSVFLSATGNNIAFYGGRGDDLAGIFGDYAYVNAGAGDDEIIIIGSNATVLGGAGDDTIIIVPIDENEVSQGNIVYGEAGNDIINIAYTTGTNFLYAGAGNDMIIGGEGNDFIYGMSGNNVLIGNGGEDRIFGGTGRDLILASTTAKIRDAENLAEKYSDLYTAWSLTDDPDLDALVELIGVESVADGAKDWLYRGAGIGNIIYSNTSKETDKDFASTLTFAPFNDVLYDDLEDLI